MEIKPGSYNLRDWQNSYDWESRQAVINEVAIHTNVCDARNTKWIGKIVDIGPKDVVTTYGGVTKKYVGQVTVFWMSGPRRGMTQFERSSLSLVNYDAFREAIRKEADDLDKALAEAQKVGL